MRFHLKIRNVFQGLVFLILIISFVDSVMATPIRLDNFFVGASVGYNWFHDLNYSGSGIETIVPIVFPKVTGRVPASDFSGLIGEGELGYTKSYKHFLLTSDVFIINATNSATFSKMIPATINTFPSETLVNGSVNPSCQYGIELKPGYSLTSKIVLSAIIGYGWAPYTLTLSSLVGQTVLEPKDRYKAQETQSFSGKHIITGIEFNFLLTHAIMLNLIFKHNIYQGSDKLSFTKSGTAFFDSFQASGELDGVDSTNLLLLGVRYYF